MGSPDDDFNERRHTAAREHADTAPPGREPTERERLEHRDAYWTYDEADGERAYYFAPLTAVPGPYFKQIHVEAILDVASDGTLAGVELVHGDLPPAPQKEVMLLDPAGNVGPAHETRPRSIASMLSEARRPDATPKPAFAADDAELIELAKSQAVIERQIGCAGTSDLLVRLATRIEVLASENISLTHSLQEAWNRNADIAPELNVLRAETATRGKENQHLRTELINSRCEAVRLREALEPFAAFADLFDKTIPNHTFIETFASYFTLGMFRIARAALAGHTKASPAWNEAIETAADLAGKLYNERGDVIADNIRALKRQEKA